MQAFFLKNRRGQKQYLLKIFPAVIIKCYYFSAKYGSSNTKIKDLFAVIPQLREMGLLEHQLGQNLSLLKDQSYPIPDPTQLKQDFPLPDLLHDAIMTPKQEAPS